MTSANGVNGNVPTAPMTDNTKTDQSKPTLHMREVDSFAWQFITPNYGKIGHDTPMGKKLLDHLQTKRVVQGQLKPSKLYLKKHEALANTELGRQFSEICRLEIGEDERGFNVNALLLPAWEIQFSTPDGKPLSKEDPVVADAMKEMTIKSAEHPNAKHITQQSCVIQIVVGRKPGPAAG